jgi:hypothetical protein
VPFCVGDCRVTDDAGRVLGEIVDNHPTRRTISGVGCASAHRGFRVGPARPHAGAERASNTRTSAEIGSRGAIGTVIPTPIHRLRRHQHGRDAHVTTAQLDSEIPRRQASSE